MNANKCKQAKQNKAFNYTVLHMLTNTYDDCSQMQAGYIRFKQPTIYALT